MNLENSLLKRSNSECELCSSGSSLGIYNIPPVVESSAKNSIIICNICRDLIENPSANINHWRCLSETMWSEYSPVQVMAWRTLKKLSGNDWARDLLEQLFLDDETQKWAESISSNEIEVDNTQPTKDSNGTILAEGDSVTLIKDLEVKGANFTAKRGTLVKNISLTSNPEHIEGRVNGTHIVLLTCFLKKAI